MNRTERRKYAKRINTPQKIEQFGFEIDKRLRKEYEEKSKRQTKKFIESYTIFVAYVLHYKLGLGKKRLPVIMEDIKKHIEMLDEGYISLEDCKNELKKAEIELKFD